MLALPVFLGVYMCMIQTHFSIFSLQLSACLQNIPSCSDPTQCLGALAIAESFVDSVITVDTGWDTQCLVLTSDIPAVISWPVRYIWLYVSC